MLSLALDNVKPVVEAKSRRVGGATYQVPVEVRSDPPPDPGDALDDRGRPGALREVHGVPPGARADGRRGEPGSAVSKREDTHRMAEANKAFALYRW